MMSFCLPWIDASPFEVTHNPLEVTHHYLKCVMSNQKIPNGDKSDSYCVINNVANREERKNNIRSDSLDDCGTWDTNTEDFI